MFSLSRSDRVDDHKSSRSKRTSSSSSSSAGVLLSPRLLSSTPLETIRTSAENGRTFFTSVSTTSIHDSMADESDGSGSSSSSACSLPVVMWGRTGPISPSSLPMQLTIATRTNQARAKAHTARPSTREPIRQFEEKIATLPVLRDALAAEHTSLPSPNPPRSGAPSPSPYLFQSTTPSPVSFTTNAQQFGKSLLQRQCGSFMVRSMEEAENVIGALRLELQLLRRINDGLSNPGRRSDGENVITPYTFSEENFQILYLENSKLRELLQTTVGRYDANELILQQRMKELKQEQEELERMKKENITLKMRQASLEQSLVNAKFKHEQVERALILAENQKARSQLESTELLSKFTALEEEHVLCAAFKSLVEEERESFRNELTEARKEILQASAAREKVSAACAAVEGRLVVQLELAEKHRSELTRMRQEKDAIHALHLSIQDELSQARVSLVQSDGDRNQLRRDYDACLLDLNKLRDDFERSKCSSNDSSQLLESERLIQDLRQQLEDAKQHGMNLAERHVEAIQSIEERMNGITKDHASAQNEKERFIQMNRVLNQQELEQRKLLRDLEVENARLKRELKEIRMSQKGEEGEDTNIASPPLSPTTTTTAMTPRQKKKDQRLNAATTEDKDPAKLLLRIRELEVNCKELEHSADAHRRMNDASQSKLSKAELELDRESNLRRVQLKSAKEIRKRLESQLAVLDLRCAAMAKALMQLGEKGAKVVERLGPTTTTNNITTQQDEEEP